MTSIKYILVTVLVAKVCFAQAQTNSTTASKYYFTIQQHIADSNIFNPNRVPGVSYVVDTRRFRTNPPVVNSFSLVGTMNYGEGNSAGVYAFFDGTSTQFRKAAVLNDSIAVFKIVAINKDSVTLMQNTNKVILQVGDQMRDDTKGHWQPGGQAMGSYQSSSYSRNANFGSSYDIGGRTRGRDYNANYNYNSGNNNFRSSADQYGTQFNRNTRSVQRGGTATATQDFQFDPQGADFGGFPDGPVIIIQDSSTPPDAGPEE